MASKLAEQINSAVLSTDADQPFAVVAIDAELQEAREVLDGLLGEVETEGDDQSELCQRARDLMEKLKP